jgi:hypothetical protein
LPATIAFPIGSLVEALSAGLGVDQHTLEVRRFHRTQDGEPPFVHRIE